MRLEHLVLVILFLVVSVPSNLAGADASVTDKYVLIPPPQQIEWRTGTGLTSRQLTISSPADWAEQTERYLWLINDLPNKPGFNATMVSDPSQATVLIQPTSSSPGPEGYRLEISQAQARIEASDMDGVFNALATLAQLAEQCPTESAGLPPCRIVDYANLPLRAVHIDLTAQQYTPGYVRILMHELARFKINGILMEYSDSFPFRDPHAAIRRPDAFDEGDIRAILQTAADCRQEVIPLQQCLGHLDYLLYQEPYARLGKDHGAYMVCPLEEASLKLIFELIDNIADQHPALRYLHLGGDEVGPQGCPKCEAYAEKHSFSSLYVNHYRRVAEHCRQRGIRPLMWSDVILHNPEALKELPSDIVWVEWDYRCTTDPTPKLMQGAALGHSDKLKPLYREYFGEGIGLAEAERRGGFAAFGHVAGFKKLGYEAITAPAARFSGNNFALPRYAIHMENIRLAMIKAVQYKSLGSIITSWSYRLSPHEVCMPSYACAAYGWNVSTPNIAILLKQFLALRYGIDEPALAEGLLGMPEDAPPTTAATPRWDKDHRRWVMTGAQQFDQIAKFAAKKSPPSPETNRQQIKALDDLARILEHSTTQAQRRRAELAFWELSLSHLRHRLQLLEQLYPLVKPTNNKQAAQDKSFIDNFMQQILTLKQQRLDLRRRWAELFAEINTVSFHPTDLYIRFDAEDEIVDLAIKAAAKSP